MLYVNDGNTKRIGLLDRTFDILQDNVRVPQGKRTTGKIVVLKINNQ